MCPGGTVVAATSEPGRVVTNGMSQYSRNERNANAGIVVGITPEDYRAAGSSGAVGPLDGIAFQRFWESRAYRARRRRLRRAGAAGRRLPRRARLDRVRRGAAVVQAGRAAHRPRRARQRKPARLRDRGDPRGAAGVRAPDRRLRDARRGADRRRDAHLVAAAHHARQGLPEPERRAASIRPAKARAMPAASCRRRSTASRSPRPSPAPCSAKAPVRAPERAGAAALAQGQAAITCATAAVSFLP